MTSTHRETLPGAGQIIHPPGPLLLLPMEDAEFRVAVAEAHADWLEEQKDHLMAVVVTLLRRLDGHTIIPDSEVEPVEGQTFGISTLRIADDSATEIFLDEDSDSD